MNFFIIEIIGIGGSGVVGGVVIIGSSIVAEDVGIVVKTPCQSIYINKR